MDTAWDELQPHLIQKSPACIKREDIPKNVALYKVRQEIEARGLEPSSEKWTSSTAFREFLLKRALEINPELKGMTTDEAVEIYLQIRKNKKRRLLIEIGELYSWTCFYLHSSDAACDDRITLERLVPGKRGGQYVPGNVRVACFRHNVERSYKDLEDALKQ